MDPTNIIAAVALVGILVFIHEFGHFVFAKIFGVRVLVFSLGFGRRLFGFQRGGTDYRVCLLPIGGYVQMQGADPFMDGGDLGDPGYANAPGNFLNKPVWQRLIIVSAGPVFNLLLPVLVFTALYMGGEPHQVSQVGTVHADTPADQAGVETGDRIVEVDGQPVAFWSELYPLLAADAADGAVSLVMERDGQRRVLEMPLPADTSVEDGRLSPLVFGLDYLLPDTLVGVDPSSPAGAGGLENMDRVRSVGGEAVENYHALVGRLDAAGAGPVEVVVEREDADGEIVERTLTLTASPGWGGPDLGFEDLRANPWGVYPGYLMVGEVIEGSPAEASKIQVGDRMAGIDGSGLLSWSDVLRQVKEKQVGEGSDASAEPVVFTLVRAGEAVHLELTPEIVRDTDSLGRYQQRARVGIAAASGTVRGALAPHYYSLGAALPRATDETIGLARFTLEQVGKLITGEAAPSKTLGGPVQIFRDAGRAAEEGIFTWARMMGLLSISLGIINFLPVPVLDGGQFLFYLVEGIRGRPLSLAVRERAQQIGVLFLVALMFTVLVFDMNRWLSG